MRPTCVWCGRVKGTGSPYNDKVVEVEEGRLCWQEFGDDRHCGGEASAPERLEDLRAQLTAAQARIDELEAKLDRICGKSEKRCDTFSSRKGYGDLVHLLDCDGIADEVDDGTADGDDVYAVMHLRVERLIAERDDLRARAEKAEGDARFFLSHIRTAVVLMDDELHARAKPYETP